MRSDERSAVMRGTSAGVRVCGVSGKREERQGVRGGDTSPGM